MRRSIPSAERSPAPETPVQHRYPRGDAQDTAASPTGATPTSEGTPMSPSMAMTPSNAATQHGIFVAVRVRPFNKKELEMQDDMQPQPCIEVERDGQHMTLLDPTKGFADRSNFTFDRVFSAFQPSIVLSTDRRAYDSDEDEEELEAERAQAEIYAAFGAPVLQSAWAGYNACIFAYGQTSSGKTYTMMGTKRDPGVIPRLCRELFQRIEEEETEARLAGNAKRRVTKCSVCYMEIYNEQVKDLLKPKPTNMKKHFKSRFDTASIEDSDYKNLKVRQHPLHGPFVEGATKLEVGNWLDCVRVIRSGNEYRSSASTAMNDTSSRSHAIFQMILTQTEALGARVRGKEVTNVKSAKMNLVDLAGSERITRTNVTGKHQVEATYINQSLSTLRKVIDVLVQKRKTGASPVVPYRESLLTWILSDNFGGNSKTTMIAAVSPHQSNFLETESTLRYATLAKGIVNRVRVNEDPSAKLIRELQAQLKALQLEMTKGPQSDRVVELESEMEANRAAMQDLHQREENMKAAIKESHRREEELINEREELKRDQMKWRDEAQRLKREKDALRNVLAKLGHANEFWMTEETIEREQNSESESFVPPNQARKRTDSATEVTVSDSSAPAPAPQPMARRTSEGTSLAQKRVSQRSLLGGPPKDGAPTDSTKKHDLTDKAKKESPPPEVPPWQLSDDAVDGPIHPAPQTENSKPPAIRRGSPPPAHLALSRTANPPLSDGSPTVAQPPRAATTTGSAESPDDKVVLPPYSQTPQPMHTASPVPKYGRRAATEEGSQRAPLNQVSQSSPSPSTAGGDPTLNRMERRRILEEATPAAHSQPNPLLPGERRVAGAPMSLAHLARPGDGAGIATSSSAPYPAPAPAVPEHDKGGQGKGVEKGGKSDALDSFLAGGGVMLPKKGRRA